MWLLCFTVVTVVRCRKRSSSSLRMIRKLCVTPVKTLEPPPSGDQSQAKPRCCSACVIPGDASVTHTCGETLSLKSRGSLEPVYSAVKLHFNRSKHCLFCCLHPERHERQQSGGEAPTETVDGGHEQFLWKAAVDPLQPLFFPS